MKRREFLGTVAGSALACALPAMAEESDWSIREVAERLRGAMHRLCRKAERGGSRKALKAEGISEAICAGIEPDVIADRCERYARVQFNVPQGQVTVAWTKGHPPMMLVVNRNWTRREVWT